MPFTFLLNLIFIQFPQKLSTLNVSLQYDNLTVVLLALLIFLDLADLFFYRSYCEFIIYIHFSFEFFFSFFVK